MSQASRREIFANLGITPQDIARKRRREAMAMMTSASARRSGLKGMGAVREAMDQAAGSIDEMATAADIAGDAAALIESFIDDPEADDARECLAQAAALLVHALDEAAPPAVERPGAEQS